MSENAIDYAQIKEQIKAGMVKRATTRRVKEILEVQGIGYTRGAVWEWLNIPHRTHRHEAQFAAAFLQAIEERLSDKRQVGQKLELTKQAARRLAQT